MPPAQVSRACSSILGYSESELIGTSPYSLIHPDDMDRVRQAYGAGAEQVRRQREGDTGADGYADALIAAHTASIACVARWRRRDGSYTHVESTVQWRSLSGSETVVTSISRDVSARMQLEQERSSALERHELLAQVTVPPPFRLLVFTALPIHSPPLPSSRLDTPGFPGATSTCSLSVCRAEPDT